MLTNVMAMATTQAMSLATTWQVTKWVMARVTRAIVTNAVATVAVVLASAVTAAIFIAAATITIAQCRCPWRSHCSGCRHCPPHQDCNQTAMALVMVKEAMATATRVAGKQWQWQHHAQW
jgi:hypothetical protein